MRGEDNKPKGTRNGSSDAVPALCSLPLPLREERAVRLLSCILVQTARPQRRHSPGVGRRRDCEAGASAEPRKLSNARAGCGHPRLRACLCGWRRCLPERMIAVGNDMLRVKTQPALRHDWSCRRPPAARQAVGVVGGARSPSPSHPMLCGPSLQGRRHKENC